ncbi:MAG TPA: heme-binding protein [Myxococcaceae bacterium]|nr:heme-binding protein [Myxococcaceae bacterium]
MNLRLLLTTALLFTGAARAQLATSKVLTLDAARRIAAAAAVEARTDRTSGIAIVDAGGALVYFERLDGTFPAAASVSFGKAHTAATFQHATKDFEDAVHNGRGALTGVKEMTPLQGGVPIVVDGKVIGAVGVSGASSAARDEAIARAAIASAAQLSAEPAKSATVATLPAATVKAGFAKGSVLLDRGDYQVHASRRDAPGKAEVHQIDTDVFYVLEGTATLVTGGKVPDLALTGPHELRGSRIDGGDVRTIGPGDVVVVPSGTPHWFREVKAPVLYFAVKVAGDGVVQ